MNYKMLLSVIITILVMNVVYAPTAVEKPAQGSAAYTPPILAKSFGGVVKEYTPAAQAKAAGVPTKQYIPPALAAKARRAEVFTEMAKRGPIKVRSVREDLKERRARAAEYIKSSSTSTAGRPAAKKSAEVLATKRFGISPGLAAKERRAAIFRERLKG